MGTFEYGAFADVANIFNFRSGEAKAVPGWRAALQNATSVTPASSFLDLQGYVLFRSFMPQNDVLPAASVSNDNIVAEETPAVSAALSTRFMDPAHVALAPIMLPAPVVIEAPVVEEIAAPVVVEAPVAEVAVPVEEAAAPVAVAEEPAKRGTLKLKNAPVAEASASFTEAAAAAPAATEAAPAKRRTLSLGKSVSLDAPAESAPVSMSHDFAAAKPRGTLSLKSDTRPKLSMSAAVGITRRSSADDLAAAFKAELKLAELQGLVEAPKPARPVGQKRWDELTSAFKQEMNRALVQEQKPVAPVVRSKTAFNMKSAGVPAAVLKMRPAGAAAPAMSNAA